MSKNRQARLEREFVISNKLSHSFFVSSRGMIALEFDTRKEYEIYKKEHSIDPKTKIIIKEEFGKKNKVKNPSNKPQGKPQDKPQGKPQTNVQKGFFSEKENSLPDIISQSTKNKDELYGSAKEAQKSMMDWLDSGGEFEKKLGLKHYDLSKPEQQKIDYDKSGPILITAPPKGEQRASEKVNSDYDGDWSRLTDVVRATIAVDRFDEVDGVIKLLRESGMKLAKKPKDRFNRPTMVGYRDIMMNVRYSNGHIGELQVHIKSMLKAKKIGHKLYEQVRDIESRLKKEGKDSLTPEEQSIYEETNKKMYDLYNEAWTKSIKRRVGMKNDKKTRYFKFNGNPTEWVSSKVPIMFVNGKKIPVYNMFRFVHESEEIEEKEFKKMIGRKKESSVVAKNLSDEQIQSVAEKVIESIKQSEVEPEGDVLLPLDEETTSNKQANNRRIDMSLQNLIIASVSTMGVFRRFAKLSEEERKEVIEKVKEKMNIKDEDKKDDSSSDTGKEEVPSDSGDKVVEEETKEESTSQGESEEEPKDKEGEEGEEVIDKVKKNIVVDEEDGSDGEVVEEEPKDEIEDNEDVEEDGDEITDEGGDEVVDEGGDQKEEISDIVNSLVEEVKTIKEDGKVSPSEVFGLITNMVEMVNTLVEAKPARKRKKSSRIAREFLIAERLTTEQHGSLNDASPFGYGYGFGNTHIWYMRPDFFRDASMGYEWLEEKGLLPNPDNLDATHILLGSIRESNMNKVMRMMQGESWSPEGQARTLIRTKGLQHTSMSVGDVIVLHGNAYMVDRFGFKLLPSSGDRYE